MSGGKTGTAQAVTIGQKDKYDGKKLEEFQRDHALYMAFAPADKPKIALAVVVENAGFGAAHAAPIARRVFDYVLMGQYPNAEDMLAVQKGLAAAPIGKPLMAADMAALVGSGPPGVMTTAAVLPAAAASAAQVKSPVKTAAAPAAVGARLN